MKNKLLFSALLMSIASLFTACSDDNDSNPTFIQPTGFTLNTPAFINETVDLSSTESLRLTWSQPQFTTDNAPINATYEIQVSPTGDFNVSFAEAEDDESGSTVADYAIIDRTTSLCYYDLTSEDLDKALIQVAKWPENAVPDEYTAYVRVNAYFLEGGKKLNPVASNVVEISVNPYYIELKDAAPIIWYMVGNCIGSAEWNNSADAVGKGLIPLMPMGDQLYDKKTGEGVISYTTWFPKDGQLKLVREPGSWDIQLNYNDVDAPDESLIYSADGGNANIAFNVAGYYTVSLDTKTNKITVKQYTDIVKVYDNMYIAGSHNEWNAKAAENALVAGETLNNENHLWVGDVIFPAGTEYKFATFDWGTDWGGAFSTLWGTAKHGPDNSKAPEGNFKVLFNDITGQYLFIEK